MKVIEVEERDLPVLLKLTNNRGDYRWYEIVREGKALRVCLNTVRKAVEKLFWHERTKRV